MNAFAFPPPPPCPEAEIPRREIRDFPKTTLAGRIPVRRAESFTGLDPACSRLARTRVDAEPDAPSTRAFPAVLAHTMLHAPSFGLRGGTRESPLGVIARGLGLR